MPEAVRCRVCGQQASIQAIGRVINQQFPLLQCSVCTTVQTAEPQAADGSALYNELYSPEGDVSYDKHNAEFTRILNGGQPHRPYHARLLAQVEKRCAGRRLIEIGGGVGIFGKIAQTRGWDYTNYDVSELALSQAQQLGLRTQRIENLQFDLKPNSADLITLWEVIEHIHDVADYLKIIRAALSPQGILLMSTPNYWRTAYQRSESWGVGMAPPVHINFFTEQSLSRVLRLNGFANNNVFVRRLYAPGGASLRSLARPLKYLLRLEAPPTLYSISH
jgi:SAM-dependent methyltransferase